MINIFHTETAADIADAQRLFREYETWLGMDLCFQSFEEEVRDLPGRYAKPEGRLFLAAVDEKPAGCVALRKLEKDVCEMKRLFVRGEYRGRGIGEMMVEKLIQAARAVGYQKIRLDTHPPKMKKALRLYEARGFRIIPPYYDNPHGGVLFMELDL